MNTTDGRLSVRMEPASGRDHSVLARLAAQPLTASLDLSRGELASESASVHNASRAQGAPHTVPQPVELSPWAEVSLSLRAPIERAGLAAWLRHSRPVLGFPVLGRPLTASRLELVASYPRAVNVSVSLGWSPGCSTSLRATKSVLPGLNDGGCVCHGFLWVFEKIRFGCTEAFLSIGLC